MPEQRANLSSMQQAELARLRGTDPVLDGMMRRKEPLTRDMYLALNYGPDLPVPWTAEHEAEVPAPFQDWSQVQQG